MKWRGKSPPPRAVRPGARQTPRGARQTGKNGPPARPAGNGGYLPGSSHPAHHRGRPPQGSLQRNDRRSTGSPAGDRIRLTKVQHFFSLRGGPAAAPAPQHRTRQPSPLPTSPIVEAASRRFSPHTPPGTPTSRSAPLPTSPLRTSAPQALDCCKNYSSLCVRSTPASYPPTTPPPYQPGTARLRTRASQQATPPPNPHAYPPTPPNKPPPNTPPFTIYYSPFTISAPHHRRAPRDRPGSLPGRPHPPPPFHARHADAYPHPCRVGCRAKAQARRRPRRD